jgi:hypothetical protein
MFYNLIIVLLGLMLVSAVALLVVSIVSPVATHAEESIIKDRHDVVIDLPTTERPQQLNVRQIAAVQARFDALYSHNEREFEAARERHRDLREAIVDGLVETAGFANFEEEFASAIARDPKNMNDRNPRRLS